MGEAPRAGDSCVDLGAAPGGWTHTALGRGARVVAVDRAPLAASVTARAAAAGPGRLQTVRADAFTYQPPRPVDWLLGDVIREPARTLALLRRWLGARWCKKMVLTVKFKGAAGYHVVAEFRQALADAGATRFRIKHLHHNKNEVTVMLAAL